MRNKLTIIIARTVKMTTLRKETTDWKKENRVEKSNRDLVTEGTNHQTTMTFKKEGTQHLSSKGAATSNIKGSTSSIKRNIHSTLRKTAFFPAASRRSKDACTRREVIRDQQRNSEFVFVNKTLLQHII